MRGGLTLLATLDETKGLPGRGDRSHPESRGAGETGSSTAKLLGHVQLLRDVDLLGGKVVVDKAHDGVCAGGDVGRQRTGRSGLDVGAATSPASIFFSSASGTEDVGAGLPSSITRSSLARFGSLPKSVQYNRVTLQFLQFASLPERWR
jgi:hypothetical protein